MRFTNINLSDPYFKILFEACIINKTRQNLQSDDINIAFILLEELNMKERLLLRKNLNEPNCRVVAVSQNTRVALFSWKTGCFHFMQIPFDPDQLKLLRQKVETLGNHLLILDKKMRLGYTGGHDILSLKEINFILGAGDYCQVFCRGQDGKTYTYRMKKFDEALRYEPNFIKITKSIIVNMNNVAQISRNKVKFINSKAVLNLSERAKAILMNQLFWKNI